MNLNSKKNQPVNIQLEIIKSKDNRSHSESLLQKFQQENQYLAGFIFINIAIKFLENRNQVNPKQKTKNIKMDDTTPQNSLLENQKPLCFF